MNENLEKAKEIIAKELNYKDWETCINDQPNYKIEGIMDKVAERYHELMEDEDKNEKLYIVFHNEREGLVQLSNMLTYESAIEHSNSWKNKKTHICKYITPPKQ